MNGVHVPSITAVPWDKGSFCLNLWMKSWHSTAGNDTNIKQHLQILRLCRAERRKNKDRLGLLKMWLQVMLDGYLVLQGKACCLKQLWSLWTPQVALFPIKKLFYFLQGLKLPTFNQLTWSRSCSLWKTAQGTVTEGVLFPIFRLKISKLLLERWWKTRPDSPWEG